MRDLHRFVDPLLAAWMVLSCASIPPAGAAPRGEYSTERFDFSNGEIRLSGTLYVPDSAGRHPVVVLLHGSEAVPRGGTFGLYLKVADAFARRGVAALVYDKRGAGESGGDHRTALFADFAMDAIQAAKKLAEMEKIDRDQIGLWGISQGGWIAPLAASLCDEVDFVISVSAPATSEGEQRLFEWSQKLRRKKVPEDHIDALLDARRRIWKYCATGEGWEAVQETWRAAKKEPWWPHLREKYRPQGPANPAEIAELWNTHEFKWYRTDRAHDPLRVLEGLSVPAMVIFGSSDHRIPWEIGRKRIQNLFAARDHSHVVLHEGANHALMVGFPPRFPKGYFDGMVSWIRKLGSSPRDKD